MTYANQQQHAEPYLIATIKVEQVSHIRVDQNSIARSVSGTPTKRVKAAVTHLTIRAKDMESMRRKIAGHMDLIDNDVVGAEDE